MRLWEQKVPQIILNNHETTKNELLTSFYYTYMIMAMKKEKNSTENKNDFSNNKNNKCK